MDTSRVTSQDIVTADAGTVIVTARKDGAYRVVFTCTEAPVYIDGALARVAVYRSSDGKEAYASDVARHALCSDYNLVSFTVPEEQVSEITDLLKPVGWADEATQPIPEHLIREIVELVEWCDLEAAASIGRQLVAINHNWSK